eukprot:Nk52_evm33s1967 gene=Nk52_evmTU33s1967
MTRCSISPPASSRRLDYTKSIRSRSGCVTKASAGSMLPPNSRWANVGYNAFVSSFWPKPNTEQNLAPKILERALENEKRYRPNALYLSFVQKSEIKEFMRRDIVEWMQKLNSHFHFESETFATAVNYMDRFLSTMKVKPNHLQIIGVCCLLLASKFQEAWNTHPSLKELVIACNHMYTASDIERMEKLVINKLNWEMHSVTPHVVAHQIATSLPLDKDARERLAVEAETYLDGCLRHSDCLKFPPHVLAVCAVALCLPSTSTVDLNTEVFKWARVEKFVVAECFEFLSLVVPKLAPVM